MVTELLKKKVQHAAQSGPHAQIIRKISLFGSRLHGDARPDSDIDLLIEFSGSIGLFGLVSLERHFSESLGTPVDLMTPEELSPYFRDEVLAEALPLYDQT